MSMLRCLIGIVLVLLLGWTAPVWAVSAKPDLDNYSTEQLDRGDELRTQAFLSTNKGDFAAAEGQWSQLLELFPNNPAIWSNRGNSRVSQHKLPEAIQDFNRSIELAPQLTDAYLNRGAAWEGMKEWDKAITDYRHILEVDANDAMAYNNLGNAYAGQGAWDKAKEYFQKATELDSRFAFARANYALALYQLGEQAEAIRTLKNIARKYRDFPDVRAALTAALWQNGQRGEAESNWIAAIGLDARYRNLDWVKDNRRWPPVMVAALENFLHLR